MTVSTSKFATPYIPPLFLVHATDDPVSEVDHSVTMYLATKRLGASAELHVYATGGHSFAVRKVDHPCAGWSERCVDWLRSRELLGPAARQ